MKVGDLVRVVYRPKKGDIDYTEDINDVGIFLDKYYNHKLGEELIRVFVNNIIMEYFEECDVEVISERR